MYFKVDYWRPYSHKSSFDSSLINKKSIKEPHFIEKINDCIRAYFTGGNDCIREQQCHQHLHMTTPLYPQGKTMRKKIFLFYDRMFHLKQLIGTPKWLFMCTIYMGGFISPKFQLWCPCIYCVQYIYIFRL